MYLIFHVSANIEASCGKILPQTGSILGDNGHLDKENVLILIRYGRMRSYIVFIHIRQKYSKQNLHR